MHLQLGHLVGQRWRHNTLVHSLPAGTSYMALPNYQGIEKCTGSCTHKVEVNSGQLIIVEMVKCNHTDGNSTLNIFTFLEVLDLCFY